MGREKIHDPMNEDLFLRMLRNYVKQHQAMGNKFHPEFESDLNRLKMLKGVSYAGALGGFMFAATVINPNFIKRRSWYMRKIQLFAWGVVGYNLGHRYYTDQMTFTMLRMNDYFPVEVKRALRD